MATQAPLRRPRQRLRFVCATSSSSLSLRRSQRQRQLFLDGEQLCQLFVGEHVEIDLLVDLDTAFRRRNHARAVLPCAKILAELFEGVEFWMQLEPRLADGRDRLALPGDSTFLASSLSDLTLRLWLR